MNAWDPALAQPGNFNRSGNYSMNPMSSNYGRSSHEVEHHATVQATVDAVNTNILNGQTRASNVLRDRYASRLAEAVAHGCITNDEYQARVDAAMQAQTERQLAALESDLPDIKRHIQGPPRSSYYQRWCSWMDVSAHRHFVQIAGFPFFLLWGILGGVLPYEAFRSTAGIGLLGSLLMTIFIITGSVGFIGNLISYAVWTSE